MRVHKDDKEDMEMAFKEVAIESLEFNPFTKISKEWMLVTAGDEKKSNTMTASWGGVRISQLHISAHRDTRRNSWMRPVCTRFLSCQKITEKH